MVSIPSGIFDSFYNIADLLITDVNASTAKVILPISQDTSSSSSFPASTPSVVGGFDHYGGRMPNPSVDSDQNPGDNLSLRQDGPEIECRVYWDDAEINRVMKDLEIENSENVCKVITWVQYSDLIENADHLIVTNTANKPVRVSLLKSPLLYGLGPTKKYCMSFWIEQK